MKHQEISSFRLVNELSFNSFPDVKKTFYQEKNEFRFLNQSYRFEKEINWNNIENGKLWLYNLTYFDFLNQPELTAESAEELIISFIQYKNTVQEKIIADDPYPTSLRGINLIKCIVNHGIKNDRIDHFLHTEYNRLFNNLEYHLLGNHLLENGLSLLFGGYYLHNTDLINKGVEIVQEQLDEQILNDGMHFELSDMYHVILLDRLLDVCNLLISNEDYFLLKSGFLLSLQTYVKKMLGALEQITFDNGDLAFINDAIKGLTKPRDVICEYASQMQLYPEKISLSDSGYRKYKMLNYESLIDVGSIGPIYIPGHGHSDHFNFLVYYKGQPLIVDTGTSSYENDDYRYYERSTKAHNTVEVGGENQSDVWSVFRVGKRALVKVNEEKENQISAELTSSIKHKYNHKRTFTCLPESMIIQDQVDVKEQLSKAYFHFPSTVSLMKENDLKIKVETDIVLTFEGATECMIEKCFIADGYGKRVEAQKVCAVFTESLNSTFTFGHN